MLNKKKIKQIIQKIIQELRPQKIYLFGSYAKEQATADSDLDLLVIADMPGPKNRRSLEVRKLFPQRDFSLDVLVYTEQEFAEESQVVNTVGHIAATKGKLLYAG